MVNQRVWLLLAAAIMMSVPVLGQITTLPNPATGQIAGTITDSSGDVVSGATVVLQPVGGKDSTKLVSNDNGFFNFKQLDPGSYRVTISAPDFADWSSTDLVLNPGQYMLLSECKLRPQVTTTINVGDRPDEIATEQLKVEEKQRVFGVIPNFYVVYEPDPAPLTARMKFHLAFKTSTDIVTVLGVGALAGINQAGNTPNYRQGWAGYGERFGAAAGDGFSDIMIGGAILPSILHQDPRYHYKGTGTNRFRILHAMSSPFVCKGDNGKSQPNYSSIGGDLSSAALSNLYYPASNRGSDLVFQNFFVTTGERVLSSLVQEFVIGRLATRQRLKN